MTGLRKTGSARGLSWLCMTCVPPEMSRRQFLCTGTASVVAAASAPGMIAASSGDASAQQPGLPLLIKGGCALTLDRSLGDFETANVPIEGKAISAVRPNITAPEAEIVDASRMIVMPGLAGRHHPAAHRPSDVMPMNNAVGAVVTNMGRRMSTRADRRQDREARRSDGRPRISQGCSALAMKPATASTPLRR